MFQERKTWDLTYGHEVSAGHQENIRRRWWQLMVIGSGQGLGRTTQPVLVGNDVGGPFQRDLCFQAGISTELS